MKPAALLPGESLLHREHAPVAYRVAGVVHRVLIHIVADHQIQRLRALRQFLQPVQHPGQLLHIQPVVGVHHLVVHACGVPESLIDPLSVPAVGLMDHPDDPRMLRRQPVADGRGIILGAVVDQNDLDPVAAGEQSRHAFFHISGAVVAGNRKCDQFHVILSFLFRSVILLYKCEQNMNKYAK